MKKLKAMIQALENASAKAFKVILANLFTGKLMILSTALGDFQGTHQ